MRFRIFFNGLLVTFIIVALVFVGFGNVISLKQDNRDVIAEFDKEKITVEEYLKSIDNLEQNLARKLTEEEKKDYLNHLIFEKLWNSFLESLNFAAIVNDASVKKNIANTKSFQNEKNTFSKEKFQEFLKYNDLTEKQYLDRTKKMLLSLTLQNALFDHNNGSKIYSPFTDDVIEKIDNILNQSRIVDIIEITPPQNKIIQPSDQELKVTYENNKSSLIIPEHRELKYIYISPTDQTLFPVTDEEIDQEIFQQKANDQRDIYNLIFDTEEDAKNFKKFLGKRNFEEAAIEFKNKYSFKNLTFKNISINILPENLRQIFSLKKGEVSDIIHSDFGWHVIKIDDIHLISSEDLMKLKSQVKSEIVYEKIRSIATLISAKVHENLSLDKIAELFNIPLQTTAAVNIDAANLKDEFPENLLKDRELISKIFSNNIGKIIDVYKDNNTFFITSSKIILAKNKNFNQAKPELAKIWNDESYRQKVNKIAEETILKIKQGADIKDFNNVSLVQNVKLDSNSKHKSYPMNLTQRVFALKDKELYTESIEFNDKRLVAILKNIVNANDPARTAKLKETLSLFNASRAQSELLNHLKSTSNLKINEKLLLRAMSSN